MSKQKKRDVRNDSTAIPNEVLIDRAFDLAYEGEMTFLGPKEAEEEVVNYPGVNAGACR